MRKKNFSKTIVSFYYHEQEAYKLFLQQLSETELAFLGGRESFE